MLDLNKIEYVITHGGTFHSDDVFGVAFIRLVLGDIPVVRTVKPTENQIADCNSGKALVFDFGCAFGHPEYDHHQKDRVCRPLSDGFIMKDGNRNRFRTVGSVSCGKTLVE